MSTRKIKEAKDLENNELIYFKGHAKATYMSDGTNVEDALTKKQDEIKDLDTIRLNASRTIPSKTSELTNDSGFLTEHLDISHLENQVSELENKEIPEATIETIGGVKKFEIMDLQDKSNIDNLYKAYNTLVEQMINAGVAEDTRFVDLGLPSGTLWSAYNLGSDSIEDPGLYFQWGDTEGFYYKDGKVLDLYGNESDKVFDYKHYKWFDGTDAYRNGTHEGLIEYYVLEDEDGEYIYKLSSLKDEDNAVVLYNSELSLPSSKQIKELLQGSNRSFVMIGDQKLICFESIYNSNKLYMPVVLNIGDTSMGLVECCFWVSWINYENQAFCPVYGFYEGEPTTSSLHYDVDRSNGLPLRPVKSN